MAKLTRCQGPRLDPRRPTRPDARPPSSVASVIVALRTWRLLCDIAVASSRRPSSDSLLPRLFRDDARSGVNAAGLAAANAR